MTKSADIAAIKSLQVNTSDYFNKIHNKHEKNMACKNGCATCCYTDISVFESEAAVVVDWFKNLSLSEQQNLKTLWQNATDEFDGFSTVPQKNCCFLIDKSCSIYFARPIICRTQGAPLCWKDSDKSKINVDACALNFKDPESFPDRSEWLDLDRLTVLQTIANKDFKQKNKDQFLNTIVHNERVSLNDLKKLLCLL